MDIDWRLIIKEIVSETKEIVSHNRYIKVEEVAELFIKVLQYPVNDASINGIEIRIPNALSKLFVEPISRADKNSFFPDACKIEPYLRKVLFLVNPHLYETIKSDKKKALSSIITALDLNPNSVDYSSKIVPEQFKSEFSEHLIKAYNLRNLEGHSCTEWTNYKLYEEVRSVLVIYLYATYKYFDLLKVMVEPNDLTEYLLKQIEQYRVWQSRFVHIEGREDISEIDLYAKEILNTSEYDSKTNEEYEIIAREGKIDELRKQIVEKQMILLGEVGMGKTTTLQFIHLKDSENALKNGSALIPIYFELKNITIKQDILQLIIRRIGKSNEFVMSMLEEGRFSICFDGLNEIEKSLKVSVFTQINNILREYPKNNILISSRPQAYNREFDNYNENFRVPVFQLQKMLDKQIIEFLDKNGRNVKAYILKEINANDRLKKIIQVPLMLLMLIAVVQKEGKIPSEKAKIVRAFMHSLYDREQRQHIEFEREIFHLLLCYLGFQSRNLTGSNSGLDRDEYILPILEERRTQLGIPINLLDFLRKAVDLNLLVVDDNQYSYTHELYQEYYAAEFLHEFRKR